MTTLRARRQRSLAALTLPFTLALTLSSASGCSREPYWLEPEDLVADSLPDEDLDVEAERANPGHELYVPTEEEQLKLRDCTKEEEAAIKASDGRVTTKALGCVMFTYFAEPLAPGQRHQDE